MHGIFFPRKGTGFSFVTKSQASFSVKKTLMKQNGRILKFLKVEIPGRGR